MSNYTKATDFAAKDALPSGDAAKVIKGAEFEDEFDAIATAVNSKADTASPTFTGTVTLPTAAVTTFSLGGTTVTSTAAELNILDGVTATAAELNYLDGVTSNIQTQLDAKVGSGNIALGDNEKIIFGSDSNFSIYNDGTNHYIDDTGDGNMIFQTDGNGFFFRRSNGAAFFDALTANGQVRLYYNTGASSSIKLSTNSTGVDVTGFVVCDELRIDTPDVPSTASSSGNKGEIAYDSDYIYVCVATNTWKRAALSTW